MAISIRHFALRNTVILLLLFKGLSVFACAPLNVPSVNTLTIVGTNFIISVSNTSSWLNCPNVIDLEFACNGNNFSGLVADTYTSQPSTFNSSPYIYPTQTLSIANLCPGTVYKYRIRERNNNSPTSSSWSITYTFTTPGNPIVPTLSLTATPNIICPPAPVQLSAQISTTCGTSPITYAWFPTTGLSNPNIANPVASVTTPITYTCFVTGGATGCWGLGQTIFLNVGTGPPVPGTVAVTPSVLCIYGTVTLSSTSFTGNLQWQSSSSSNGPWNNIPGATLPNYVSPGLNASTCFRAVLTSCSNATLASNVTCALTNTVPTLVPSSGCTGTSSTISFSYTGASGTPTAVVWSPAPMSVNANSTTAIYNNSGTYYALAFFGDGCIGSTSVNLQVPSTNVLTSTVSCGALGSATVQTANMPTSVTYNWLPTTQTGSVATGLFPGTYTCIVGYNNNQCQSSSVVNMISLAPLTATVQNSPSVQCPSALTGTASILVAGGSGNTTYTWTNQNTTLHTPTVGGLASGVHTVSITDQITFCTLTETFVINSVAPMTIAVSANSPTYCVGTTATLTAQNSGGTPAYTYTWVAGTTASVNYVAEFSAGAFVYTVASTDLNNCLTTETISITYIANPIITVVNTSVCPGATGTLVAGGATTYSWNNTVGINGSVFTAAPLVATFYNVSGTALGCTGNGLGYIQMLPTPVPTITSNQPICNGQNLSFSITGGFNYLWSGPSAFISNAPTNTIVAASASLTGVYQVLVTGVNTCTTLTSTNFTIYPTPPLSATGSTVCSTGFVNLSASSLPGSVYGWVGPSFISNVQYPTFGNLTANKSGNYIVTATSAEGCTNTAIANVTITQMPTAVIASDGPLCTGKTVNFQASGGDSYVWSGPNGFSSTSQNPSIPQIPYSGGGYYGLQATTGPCVANASYSLTVWPLPGVIASNAGNVCETKTVQLLAQTAGPVVAYAWYGPSFANALPNPTRYPASMLQNGEYTLTVTDVNGCQNSSTTTVTVLHNPNVAALGATVCLNSSAVIAVSGANAYQWYGPNNFQSVLPTPTIGVIDNSKVGNYTVTGTASNGCKSTVVVEIDTMALPAAKISVIPSNTICLFNSVTLSGTGGIGYQWYGPNEIYAVGKIADFTAASTNFEGTYTLVVTDKNGCSGSVSTLLRIHPLPDGGLSGNINGCVPHCSNFSFNAIKEKTSASWEIDKTKFGNSFYKCFNAIGTYTINGTFYDSTTTCKTVKQFTVQVHPTPESNFEVRPDKPIENIDEALFANRSSGTNISNYYWYIKQPGSYFSPDPIEGPQVTHTFDDAGIYSVAMVTENKFGCRDTVVKAIEVLADFYIFVPNVFTPNGDRVNEKFVAVTRGVKQFEMSIYNRWGARVFYTKDKADGWNGDFNDKESPTGVYTWILTATSIHGEQRSMEGQVTLYR